MEIDDAILTCPKCGAPLSPVAYQEGLYSCDFCGEVEDEGDGFVVNGEFYPKDANTTSGLNDEEEWEPENEIGEKELTIGDVFADIDIAADELDPLLSTESEAGVNLLEIGFEQDPRTNGNFAGGDDKNPFHDNY